MPKSISAEPILEITLNSGQQIFARSLHISGTYDNMWEGAPNDEVNSMIFSGAPARYRRVFGEHPVYVLPPIIERWEERHPADRSRQLVVAAMPPTEIAALFDSFGSTGELSTLIIAWHQDEASLTLTEDVRQRLAGIDWQSHAREFEY